MRLLHSCILFGLLVCLLGSLSLACSGGNETASQGQTTSSISTATSGGQTSATPASATGSGAAKPAGMPDITDMKSLSSYRYSIMSKMPEGAGTGETSYIKYEWVKDQKAEHAWTEDAGGKVTEMYITIGEKHWIYLPGIGWMEQPQQNTSSTSSMPSDMATQIKKAQQDIGNSKARFDKKGTESVNGVTCIKYEYEYNLTTEIPVMTGGGTTRVETHTSGNIWISDQSNLKAYVIKSSGVTEMNQGGKKTRIETEQNLTDIGSNITIKPPEGAQTAPTGLPSFPSGMPGLPSGFPTNRPTGLPATPPVSNPALPSGTGTPPAVSSPAGNTPAFNDDFKDNLNANWVWTDPNNDASYNLNTRPGFLRLTAPDENDLAGATNYDAPRLLISAKNNFTMETLVEFDPQEVYQGAGLLVWQDEDHFLRLEYGFGGMSGLDKNIAFVHGEDGGLGLVAAVELPVKTQRIELRLQRQGNQFKSWRRQPGGVWQEIGSVEFKLDSAVQVGLTLVTQYTSSVVPADFDYFRLFIP